LYWIFQEKNREMTRQRSYVIWFVLVVLLIASLACAAPSLPGAQPTATLWVMPTLEGATGGGGSKDAGTTDGDASGGLTYPGTDTSGFSSFSSEFTMSWSGTDEAGNPVEGSYTVNQSQTTDPLATYMHWESISSDQPAGSSFEMVQIGDVSYINSPGAEGEEDSCITTSTQGSTPEQSPPFSPDTWMSGSDLSTAQVIAADESVNGVSTRHYRQTNVEGAAMAGFTTYEVNIWIANDGGYVVRQTLVAEGDLVTTGVGEGSMEWEYNLLDVNGPVTIAPPENCEAPVGVDFPKMADAAEVASFGTTLTYTTAAPIADVVAFYNDQLPALGWTAGTASTDVPGMATLEFTRGDEKVTFLITESEGKTSVLITFEIPES
jgi:hypothetical protein